MALCPIAKRLGFKKFVPYFQIEKAAKEAGIVALSSNYELYADVSSRMFSILEEYCDELHEYSIDEAFMAFDMPLHEKDWLQLGYDIRKAIWREVKLPVGVGFGPTATLAKAANHASKKLPGATGSSVINTIDERKKILSQMALADVWGVGSRLSKRLTDMGIKNAYALSQQPPKKMRKYFSILLENTVRELNGERRLQWDDVRPAKKEIYSTRSFGQRITDIEQLKFSLVTHCEVVARKLRDQGSLAGSAVFFAASSPHDDAPYYKRSVYHQFTVPTADTREVIKGAAAAIAQLYMPGVRFYKAGVGLVDLRDKNFVQGDLFNVSNDNPELMAALDSINARYGRHTMHFAGRGIEQKFAMKRRFLTPRSTTRWSEIPVIHCK